jgi:hypothetical protein
MAWDVGENVGALVMTILDQCEGARVEVVQTGVRQLAIRARWYPSHLQGRHNPVCCSLSVDRDELTSRGKLIAVDRGHRIVRELQKLEREACRVLRIGSTERG